VAIKRKVRVEVFLKPGVLDVQGKAVESALQGLGWASVEAMRIGRVLDFEVGAATQDEARVEVEAMCQKLLANLVIETYKIEIN
jgi:phosphoribosylformylglycinamidine synthase subunit PurS